jgi:hypothetical protein
MPKFFEKGNKANPGGRPKLPVEVREKAQSYTIECIEKLIEWVRSDNATASVRAAEVILNRGWGTPEVSVNHTGNVLISHQKMTEEVEKLLAQDVDYSVVEDKPCLIPPSKD